MQGERCRCGDEFLEIAKATQATCCGNSENSPFYCGRISLTSLILFSGRSNFSLGARRSLALIFVFLSWSVFYSVSQQLPYSKKNIIDDLLISSLFHFGPTYRINIMEFRTSQHNAFDSFFEITYGHGYNDPAIYKEKITMRVPGASQAYETREVIYLFGSQLRSDLDPDIKHLWSAPIKSRRGDSVAVLNIDNISADNLDMKVIDRNKKTIEHLSSLIGFYWEIPG